LLRKIIVAYITWFRLLKASWHSAAGSVATQSMMAATVALAGRMLGASSYGQIVAIAAYYGWFNLLGAYDTVAFLPRFLAVTSQGEKAQASACITSLLLKILLTGSSVGAALLFLPIGVRRMRISSLGAAAALYAAVFALTNLKATLDMISQSAGWLRRWSASNIVGAVIPVALLAGAMILWKRPTPAGIVGLYVIAASLSTAFTLFLFLQKFEIWWMLRPSLSLVRPILLAGCGPWIAILSNVLMGFGVQTLIAAHFPSSELGRYGVVGSLSAWVTGVGMAVTIPAVSDWSRLAAAHDFAALRRDFRLRQASTAAVLGTVMLLVMLAPEPILRLLYGAEFAAASPLLRIFAMSWVISGLGGWYWYCLFAMGHPWRVAPPNLAAGIPAFLLSYASIHFTHLGVQGAALATVFGSACWLATYEFNFRIVMRRHTSPSPQ